MGWEIMPKGIDQTGQACEICAKPVDAGQKFYFGNLGKRVAHAYCVWGKEEKRVKENKNG